MKAHRHQQGGFAYIAAIVVVVVLAMLATAAVRLYTTQQATSNQDILAARAWQAARAGNEWGLFQALQLNSCAAQTTLNFMAENGFTVSVKCTPTAFNVGQDASGTEIQHTIYEISALACNSAIGCPDAALVNTVEYTERRRIVTACRKTLPLPVEDC
ncbi:MSHA biogenesis protein MshP [Massilia sp. SR12]